jgi:hypothetical protein
MPVQENAVKNLISLLRMRLRAAIALLRRQLVLKNISSIDPTDIGSQRDLNTYFKGYRTSGLTYGFEFKTLR